MHYVISKVFSINMVKISEFCDISSVINIIGDDEYRDIGLGTLLSDIGITHHTNFYEKHYRKNYTKRESNTIVDISVLLLLRNDDAIRSYIKTYNIDMIKKIVVMCDKLCISHLLQIVLTTVTIPYGRAYKDRIIHHKLDGSNSDNVVHAFKNNFKPVLPTYFPYIYNNKLHDGLAHLHDPNIMNIKKLIVHHNIKSPICDGIEQIYSNGYMIKLSKRNFKTIRGMSIKGACGISNYELALCENLRELVLDYSYNDITSCNMVANTLQVLSVRSSYKLYFDHHKLIIGDAALTLCNKICVLIADDNRFITTCVPFARTLVVLHACGHCGITNKGLSLCMNLRELYADSNQYITTCAPFAKSLVVLSTRWYYYWDTPSFLDDNGIKMCTNLRELYIDDNHDITKCALFADTLEILSIKSSNICQMSNNEINACKKLRKVIR